MKRFVALVALLVGSTQLALAQSYPVKPVRIIVPFAAGGATDTVARATGVRLGELLGQPVVIENRPGASAIIGTDYVAKAAPDGYTLLLAAGPPHSAFPIFSKNVPFDTIRDFTPISMIGTAPQVIVVHPSVPAKNLVELLEYAKKNPGRLSYATAGVGSSQHMGGLLLNRAAGIDLQHVGYKGGGLALNDVLGGQVPIAVSILSNVIPHAKNGKIRLIAMVEAQRAKAAPEIPTIGEAGLPGYSLPDTWMGLVGPAKLPAPIVNALHAAVTKAIASPDVGARLDAAGFEVRGNTPAQFEAQIQRGYETYRKIAADANIQPE